MNIRMIAIDKFEKANGKLVIQTDWKCAWTTMQFYGGRYDAYPGGDVFGVCVREERPGPNHVHVPIVDYQVPPEAMRPAFVNGIKKTFLAALDGKDIWIGCMGGMGRTGLFMAVMAKAAGVEKPVEFVRYTYYNHAVETPEQYAYVSNFDVTELQSWLRKECWVRKVKGWFGRK